MRIKIRSLIIRLFSGHDLFFVDSLLPKNMAFELILFGWRPAWKGQLLDISAEYCFDKDVDHTPYFRSMIYFLKVVVCEFNVYNINHADREDSEKEKD